MAKLTGGALAARNGAAGPRSLGGPMRRHLQVRGETGEAAAFRSIELWLCQEQRFRQVRAFRPRIPVRL